MKTNAIKCCLGHLVICVEVLSLLPPLSPSTPDTNGAGECGVRTAARRADRRPDDDGEGRERRQAEAEAHAHVTQPLPLPPRAAAAGRQIGRETSSSVGARRSPGRGLACSKQQTQTTTTNNNSIRGRRWSSSERPKLCKMFELLSDVELMDFPPLSPDSSSYLQGE